MRTCISSVASDNSEGFIGDALPEGMVLELGEGYLLETSIASGDEGIEGDLDKTESGEDGGEDGGDEGGCCKDSILWIAVWELERLFNCGGGRSGRVRGREKKQRP